MKDTENGVALLIALIALSLFTLLGLYLALNLTTGIRISDNYESLVQARAAAQAGLNHTRALVRGLNYSDLLKGPDGTYTNSSLYLAQARAFSYRNPLSWALARTLDLANPVDALAPMGLSGMSDDGLICAGSTVLIPFSGIALTAPDPSRPGTAVTSRYFVKASDNNGESAELAGDPADNPFIDGDGIIIVRSMGVAGTIADKTGLALIRNSAAMFEARFQGAGMFSNLGSPVVCVGSNVLALFDGDSFRINGSSGGPGIATIDTDTSDSHDPAAVLRTAAGGRGSITGICAPSDPDYQSCIRDIAFALGSDPARARLSDAAWLYDFVFSQVPKFADNIWDGSGSINLGSDWNPKVTLVNGDLSLTGAVGGAGLLVVTGALTLGDAASWDGLVLVVGDGHFRTEGMPGGINGGMVIANLFLQGGAPVFGVPSVRIRGAGVVAAYDGGFLAMAAALLPPRQLSFREITTTMDPNY